LKANAEQVQVIACTVHVTTGTQGWKTSTYSGPRLEVIREIKHIT